VICEGVESVATLELVLVLGASVAVDETKLENDVWKSGDRNVADACVDTAVVTVILPASDQSLPVMTCARASLPYFIPFQLVATIVPTVLDPQPHCLKLPGYVFEKQSDVPLLK